MNSGKVSRMTIMVALIATALMLGPPSAMFGGMDADPVGVASAADDPRQFKIGVVDMTVSTLNPNTYTMVAEAMVIFPLYSYLMQWDSAGEKLIGDLAYDWHVSPDGLTWEFDLVETAYFLDPRTPTVRGDHQVTSEDVIWSFEIIANSDRSRLNYWPEGMIANMWANNDFHFGITLSEPFVPMLDNLISQIILPKYYWESEDLINFKNDPPIGSGAFYYATSGLPDAGVARLARNPFWHGETSYGWQLHVDEYLMIRQDDSGTCWSALTEEESIDAMMGVEPGVYVKDLPDEADIVGFHQSNGFVYEFNLCQLTDENRRLFGGSLNAGENDQLLLNTSIKTAISMAVNRTDLIDDALYGYGEWTTTLVPSQNPMSHSYGTDGHDCIGGGVPDPFDRELAREVLWDAGWRYDVSTKEYDKNDPDDWDAFQYVCPLYNSSIPAEREVLSFDFITLDTVDTWQIMANKISGWCEDIGVEATVDLQSVNEMNTAWYAADYDMWLWDWVFFPYGEAASSVLEVLTTDAIGTDSDIYLSDPVFDALYEQALREMDVDKRREIIYDMQDLIYLNRGCQALAFRDELYAFATSDWTNFGDLNTMYYLLPDIWPVWLCMNMEPLNNPAPRISGVSVSWDTASGDAEVGEPVTFMSTANDDDPLTDINYTWIWGFGGDKEETGTTAGAEHIFDTDGVHTVTLVVAETNPSNGFSDYYSTYYTVEVEVRDMGNTPPHDVTFIIDPADPDTGTLVTLKGSAVDDDGDLLYYSWDFGDGSVADGQNATHQFDEAGSWTVTLYVDDNRFGAGTRPSQDSNLVAVGPNSPPSVSVPDFGSVQVKQPETYTITAGDVDSRDVLRYTWEWGDGEVSVTSTPSTTHTYSWRGTYVVTVSVDDETGLAGHNVSRTGTVYVVNPSNKAPTIYDFEVSNDNPYIYQTVTFYANASDREGDPLTFTFEFGDGTEDSVSFGGTSEDEIVRCTYEKEYAEAGSPTAYVHVFDGVLTTDSDGIDMTVDENDAPVVEEFAPEPYGDTGVPITFLVTAYDNDGDDLTYTWYWEDDTTTVTSTDTTTHTYSESGTYSVLVVVDDGKGSDDSALAEVTVNWVPWVDPLSPRSLVQDIPATFEVTAGDNDTEDSLTIMWDFGDGSDYQYGSSVSHTYTAEGTHTRTVYVWDEFLEFRDTHNVSRSAAVEVLAPGTNYPPEVEDVPDIYATEGEEVMFTVSATDPNEDALTYTWDFGDLTDKVVGPPPVYHTYADVGTYTYTVWVYDDSGIPENNVSVDGTAYVSADMIPIADAGGDRDVDEDEIVEFTGAASTDDIEILEYAWTVNDFDGAHTYDTMEMQHVFDEPGTYTVELVVEDNIGQESDPDTITVTVRDVTDPTADAGIDQTVGIGATVTFDGTGSADNAGVVSYEWAFVDGTIQTLTGATPSYTFDTLGVYTVTFTVEDAAGNSDTDTMVVTVADLEDPVANAGPDQTVSEDDTVTFAGSGTDNVGVVSYTWTFVYDGETETMTGFAPSFVFELSGVYVITLEVADAAGNTGTDTVTITVEAAPVANEPPVANAGVDQEVTVGDTVTFSGTGTDTDGTVESYTWSFTYDAVAKELYGVAPTFPFDIVSTYTVTLTVTDDDGATDTDEMVVTVVDDVTPTNEPPVASAGLDQTVTVGAEVTFSGAGSSDDVAVVNYTWTFTYDGETETLYDVSPKFTFDIVGTCTVTLTVADAEGETDTDTVDIKVEAAVEDDDEKSFLESYGLPIGIALALIVAALVAFFVMKGRKGGKPEAASLEDMSAGEPEAASPEGMSADEPEAPQD